MEFQYQLYLTETLDLLQDFRRRFQEHLGTNLNMSTSYHQQMDSQSEKTIQTIEDMLRVCAIDFKGSWDDHLPFGRVLIQ